MATKSKSNGKVAYPKNDVVRNTSVEEYNNQKKPKRMSKEDSLLMQARYEASKAAAKVYRNAAKRQRKSAKNVYQREIQEARFTDFVARYISHSPLSALDTLPSVMDLLEDDFRQSQPTPIPTESDEAWHTSRVSIDDIYQSAQAQVDYYIREAKTYSWGATRFATQVASEIARSKKMLFDYAIGQRSTRYAWTAERKLTALASEAMLKLADL